MDDPSKYIIVRSKDSEVIARYAADSSGKSVLAQVIKKTGSDGYLMQVDGLDVVGDEDEILQAGSYVFTPSAAGTLPWQTQWTSKPAPIVLSVRLCNSHLALHRTKKSATGVGQHSTSSYYMVVVLAVLQLFLAAAASI